MKGCALCMTLCLTSAALPGRANAESSAIVNEVLQSSVVKGVVKDSNGEPLLGVNVLVKGTTIGAVTDIDGNFSFEAPADCTLVISYIGFESQEVKVKGNAPLNIILKEDSEALDEVVVVGYGVQKKRDLSGAVSSVKSRDITAIPTTNALEALQGKVAGLDLTASSGKAGADLSFTIRGERSLKASNAPLILVDGIDYGTTLDINPSDIESIEVLKDASSTAIYGTRGANGIIIVTTKKGKAGKSKVSLNAFASINMISSYPSIMNGAEYAQLKREAYRDQTTNEYLPDEQVFTVAQELEYVREGVSTDYRDLMMSNGFNQNYELSITGGTEKTQHSISLGYRGENGLFKNDNYKRLNARVALDHKLLENLKIGTNITYTYKDQNTRRDPLNMCNKIVPLSKPYDENGEVVKRIREYKKMVWSNTLSYLTTFNNIHHLDFLAGYEIDDTYNDYLSGEAYNFTTPDKHAISNGMKTVSVGGSDSRYRLVSYLSRLNYDYKNKYYLGASFRVDGSSRLHRDNRWGTFWSCCPRPAPCSRSCPCGTGSRTGPGWRSGSCSPGRRRTGRWHSCRSWRTGCAPGRSPRRCTRRCTGNR